MSKAVEGGRRGDPAVYLFPAQNSPRNCFRVRSRHGSGLLDRSAAARATVGPTKFDGPRRAVVDDAPVRQTDLLVVVADAVQRRPNLARRVRRVGPIGRHVQRPAGAVRRIGQRGPRATASEEPHPRAPRDLGRDGPPPARPKTPAQLEPCHGGARDPDEPARPRVLPRGRRDDAGRQGDGAFAGQSVEHIMAAMAELFSANFAEEVKKDTHQNALGPV